MANVSYKETIGAQVIRNGYILSPVTASTSFQTPNGINFKTDLFSSAQQDVEISIQAETSSQDDLFDLGLLETLGNLDEVYVKREIAERSRYTLLDGNGDAIFTALIYHEDECLGQHRSFVLSVAKITNDVTEPNQVFDVRRKRACESVALRLVSGSMFGNNISMNWTNGKILGQISQLRHCCRPTFEAENAAGKKVLRIQGGWGGGSCNPLWACNVTEFDIFTPTTSIEPAGTIKKYLKPFNFTSDDLFGAVFPIDLDPLAKILIIGAIFQLDVTYFERKFAGMDACILFRYLVILGIIAALVIAAQLGIIQRILFSNPQKEQQLEQ